ncbi:MAG: ABC transporter ATP-binding protein [Oscillospiraceae bacterium]
MLEVRRLTKDFSHGVFSTKKVRAVDGVSFAMEEGKTFGLVGNSGCGKTTVSRMLTRLIRPDGGEILLDGENVLRFDRKQTKRYHREVQMIFQNPEASLDPSRRVGDSLLEAMSIHGLYRSRDEGMEKVRDVLRRVGVPDSLLGRYPHQISGGEGQRLVICRALLLEPSVLILDEPTSMLDVSVQAHIMNILRDLQAELGLTYLYITHDIELLAWCSHTIGVMHKGVLVETGTQEKLLEAPEHPYTKELLRSYHEWS